MKLILDKYINSKFIKFIPLGLYDLFNYKKNIFIFFKIIIRFSKTKAFIFGRIKMF